MRLRYASTLTDYENAVGMGYEPASLQEVTRLAREANFESRHYKRNIGDRYIYDFNHSRPIYEIEELADRNSAKVKVTSTRVVIELTES